LTESLAQTVLSVKDAGLCFPLLDCIRKLYLLKLKEGWKFFNDRRERAKGFENLQEPGTMVAYVNRAQRLMTVAGIPGWFTFDELVDYTVKVDTKVVTETKGSVTRSIAGGIVAGPVGAVVGGNTAKKVSHTEESNPKMSFVVEYPFGRFESPVFTYSRKVLKLCEEIFKERTSIKKAPDASSSAADELMKFKKLLDIGAITEDEYTAKKKQLLNL
jgi:hypothetical protein